MPSPKKPQSKQAQKSLTTLGADQDVPKWCPPKAAPPCAEPAADQQEAPGEDLEYLLHLTKTHLG